MSVITVIAAGCISGVIKLIINKAVTAAKAPAKAQQSQFLAEQSLYRYRRRYPKNAVTTTRTTR